MRKRMVTRTIKVNTVTSMVTNIKTATVEKHLSIITGTMTSPRWKKW